MKAFLNLHSTTLTDRPVRRHSIGRVVERENSAFKIKLEQLHNDVVKLRMQRYIHEPFCRLKHSLNLGFPAHSKYRNVMALHCGAFLEV